MSYIYCLNSARETPLHMTFWGQVAGCLVSRKKEERFNFSKKRTEVFLVYFNQTSQRKTISGGASFLTASPDIALRTLSQLYFFS